MANGYRSGLEERIADELLAAGFPVHFEEFKVPYTKPLRMAKYTPDFWLPNGIVVESKGRFLTEDRQKMKLVKEQHPLLDIRLVFSNSKTKLTKGSPTSYGDWSQRYGFQYADKSIPCDWLTEPTNTASLKIVRTLLSA